VSLQQSIDPATMLGKPIGWTVRGPDGDQRPFAGVVRDFIPGELWGRGYRVYRAEVVPWFWLLTRIANCRIFQNQSVKDIIPAVFADCDQASFDLSGVKANHHVREYCVQYRETDFNFVSRLMEEEGIYYFFKYTDSSHTMMLADDMSAFYTTSDAELDYENNPDITAQLSAWLPHHEFAPGKWTQRDYNFETPSNTLETTKTTLLDLPQSKPYEIFDYPGLYYDKGVGEDLTTWRMEREEAPYGEVDGKGTSRYFSPGVKFKLAYHDITSLEGQYGITTASHSAADYTHFVGHDMPSHYTNSFSCIPIATLFRPPRVTPKPVVHGPHTAKVVGPSGEEIYCDQYGRIKVQFHWDRYHDYNEMSSCWIRVNQWMSGPKWGSIFTPRIGMEVIVDFLEGDPDRPIILGCVYNADNMPPYTLPDNKTQSGFKSHSSIGGTPEDFNELRFEDKIGQEDIVFHAQKDYHRSVEHDDDLTVGNNQTITITQNRTETIQQGNETLDIQQGDRSETIDQGSDSLEIKQGDRTINVDMGSSTLTAFQTITLQVGSSSIVIDQTSITLTAMTINITGTMEVNVDGLMTTIDGDAMLTLDGGIIMIG
jgi:type VI secretion system secreted protein VgrG